MNKTTTQAPSEEDDPLREPFFLEKRKILQSKLKQFHDEVVEHVGLDKQLAHDAAQRVAELVALQAHNAVNHAGHDFSLLISSTYNSTQLAAKSKEPLSLKFIHKPSRAKEFYEKCQDQTKINSMLNSNISPTTELSQNPFTETDEINSETESTSALEISQDDDDADIDEHRLIRKKSGEVLKPLLKDSSVYTYFNRKRTQSLPLTPTYKQVHFGASNVDIRYFKKKDRPAAISASNSPTLAGSPAMKIHNHSNNSSEDEVDEDDDETEYYDDSESDLDLDDELSSELTMNLGKTGNTIFNSGTTDWDLKLPNFPVLSYDDKILVQQSKVFLERMFISIDKKFLLGHIAVKNLKFEKNITVRYTLDNWSTIIEIPTIYVPDVPQILKRNQYDRFIFKIPLNGLFNSVTSATNVNTTTKSFQLCIKYVAEHDEYWDNNNFNNYEFRLTKISKKTKVPVQKLKALESHTAKPKYSSSYLKRRLSDSTLEVHPPPINSPDVFFDYTTSPPTSSRIVGTNNSPFNYNFAFSAGSNLSIDNQSYLISPILSLQKSGPKVGEDFKLTNEPSLVDGQASHTNMNNENNNNNNEKEQEKEKEKEKENKRYSPTSEFGKLSTSKPARLSGVGNSLDAKSYKELLDTYCFFSKPTVQDTGRGNLTTVSSILGLHE